MLLAEYVVDSVDLVDSKERRWANGFERGIAEKGKVPVVGASNTRRGVRFKGLLQLCGLRVFGLEFLLAHLTHPGMMREIAGRTVN